MTICYAITSDTGTLRADRQTESISRVSVLTCDKNHDFRSISGFIWQMMQGRDIVTMEGE